MRHPELVVVALALLWTRGVAGPDVDLIAQNLAGRAAGNIVQKEGTPPVVVAAWGDLFESQGNHEATARVFIERFGTVFGFPLGAPPADVVTLQSVACGPGHTLVLVPAKSGVPFVGSAVNFHFDTTGKLVGVSGRYRSAAAAQMGGRDAGAAVKAALSQAAKTVPNAYLSTDGVISEYLQEADGGAIRHVYDVRLGVGAGGAPRNIVLGPGGEVLEDSDGGFSFEAKGKVFLDYPQTQATQDGNLPGLIDAVAMFDHYKLWGKHVYAANAVATSDDDRFDFKPFTELKAPFMGEKVLTSASFLETNVYHHLMAAHDRAKEWGAAEVDEHNDMPFEVWGKANRRIEVVNGQRQYVYDLKDNARFKMWEFEFARYNPGASDRKPAIDASVIYHEYGHFVHFAINGKWLSGTPAQKLEALAVGEGFGDTLACAITGKTTVQEAWTGDPNHAWVRSVTDTTMRYPFDKSLRNRDFGAENKDYIDVHDAGKLFSGICTELKPDLGSNFMPRVIGALRFSTPASFKTFGYGLLWQDIVYDGAKNRARIFEVFKKRGVFAE